VGKLLLMFGLMLLGLKLSQAEPIFIENKGQWPEEVLFQAKIPSGLMRLQKNSFRYLFYHHPDSLDSHSLPIDGHVIEAVFWGSNPNFTVEKNEPSSHYYNYFYAHGQGSFCYAYQQIWYREFYKGIDLRVFYKDQSIKYEFWAKPGADLSQIKWQYSGADRSELEDQKIKVSHRFGVFWEDVPVAWTQENQSLEVSYFEDNGIYGFRGAFPKAGLVIDPTLIFSTFSSATSDNWGNTATYGDRGKFYSGGTVSGSSFPATNGAFDRTYNGGESDVVILKFDSAGSELIYATFLGGQSTEVPHSLIVNSKKELIILGTTSSSNFPTTLGAYDRSFNGGSNTNPMSGRSYPNGSDIFVSILSEDGSELVASTFLGGSGNDGLNHSDIASLNINNRNYGDEFRGEVIVDNSDRIYLACVTQSSDFPTTLGVLQRSLRGSQDGVLARFSSNLNQLQWSSFWGGSGRDMTFSLKIGADQRLYVGGGTSSTDFPTTSGALHSSYRGGSTDGFVSKLNLSGDTLLASTYLGTAAYDQVYFIDIDPDSGQVVAFGQTLGAYPVSQGTYRNVGSKQFLHSLKSNLQTSEWSTIFGSNSTTVNIVPTAFLVNECSRIFVAGWGGNQINRAQSYYLGGFTTNLPTTPNAYQRTTDGDDFYLGVLDKGAAKLLYGTFIGGDAGQGDHVDGGTCRFDKNGTVYHSVCSCGGRQNNFPTTPGAFSRTATSDNCTIASFKFDMNTVLASFEKNSTDSLRNGSAGCVPYTVNFTDRSIGGQRFVWDFGDSNTRTFPRRTDVSHTFRRVGIFPVKLTVTDSVTCQTISVFQDTVRVYPNGFVFPTDTTICQGQTLKLTGAGADTTAFYRWSPGLGLSDSTAQEPIFFGDTTTVYSLTITNRFGCTDRQSVAVNVSPQPKARFEWQAISNCGDLTQIQLRNTSQNANFYLWNTGIGLPDTSTTPAPLSFPRPGIYPIGLFAFNGNCSDVLVANVVVLRDTSNDFIQRVRVQGDTTICKGDTTMVSARGGSQYLWSPAVWVSDPTAPNPKVFPPSSTQFIVRVFGPTGCFVDSTVNIQVADGLQTDFELSPKYGCGALPTVLIADKLNNVSSYQVIVSDGRVFDKLPPLLTFKDAGDYKLTIVSKDGRCTDTKEIDFRLENYLPYNVFSPNGDGVNESFYVSSLPVAIKIFNRWGQKVYESAQYQNDWKADSLDDTVFYYQIQLPDGQTCKGWVTVLR
jgi:gliding motility-associated-like protein